MMNVVMMSSMKEDDRPEEYYRVVYANELALPIEAYHFSSLLSWDMDFKVSKDTYDVALDVHYASTNENIAPKSKILKFTEEIRYILSKKVLEFGSWCDHYGHPRKSMTVKMNEACSVLEGSVSSSDKCVFLRSS